ncbi:MAG: hypothetical protein WBA91_14060 [Paracoccaceae bacterium]
MDDFAELERRIMYALERIGTGMERIGSTAGSDGETAPRADTGADHSIELELVRAELEAERSANAQLTERVRAIKDRQETMVHTLEQKVARLSEQLDQQGAELQRQRQLNGDLNLSHQKLSDLVRDGLSDPDVLNTALVAEVEAMRASRKAEMAEVAEILAELKPLLGEVA